MRAMPRARHAGDKKTAYSSRIVRVNEFCMVSMGKWPVPGSVCSGICPSIMSPVHRSGGPQVIGAAHIGWPNPDVAIISAQPGRDQLPVKFYYNHLPKFVWEVTVPAGSAVSGIADLKGQVDSLFLFDIMLELLAARRFRIRRPKLRPEHKNFLGNGFLVHLDWIKSRRRALIGLGHTITKGPIAYMANTASCVRLYWK